MMFLLDFRPANRRYVRTGDKLRWRGVSLIKRGLLGVMDANFKENILLKKKQQYTISIAMITKELMMGPALITTHLQ